MNNYLLFFKTLTSFWDFLNLKRKKKEGRRKDEEMKKEKERSYNFNKRAAASSN